MKQLLTTKSWVLERSEDICKSFVLEDASKKLNNSTD